MRFTPKDQDLITELRQNKSFAKYLTGPQGQLEPSGSSASSKTNKMQSAKTKKVVCDKQISLATYVMRENWSHIKDLANPSCQKLKGHPIDISAQA